LLVMGLYLGLEALGRLASSSALGELVLTGF
jgi:hypothetical protein